MRTWLRILIITLLLASGLYGNVTTAQTQPLPKRPVQLPSRPTVVRKATRTGGASSFSERQKSGGQDNPIPTLADPKAVMSELIQCANLVYAGSKSSVCFSDKFLDTVKRETNCQPDKNFKTIKLANEDLFNYPFSIMTGEGAFVLQEQERKNLRAYLLRGGFLLASAGCSSRDWNTSFRNEITRIFPEYKLQKLTLEHPLFHTVFDVRDVKLSHGGRGEIEGMEIDGKIVLVYSAEGLNDTGNVNGCCCCGGNEVINCHEINVNAFTYAVTH